MKNYRILSLDGGGSWARIEVQALMQIYGAATTGHALLGQFDMVAANSGGSIVAAGLAENLKLSEIDALFGDADQVGHLFSPLTWREKLKPIRWLVDGPRFSTERKREGMARLLPWAGAQPLNALVIRGRHGEPVRFLIPTYHYDRERVSFMRSWNSLAGAFSAAPDSVTLLDAVHASSTAPLIFFDRPAVVAGDRYWDGAMSGFNNPVLAAVTEARALGWPADEIAVLSLGTANSRRPVQAPGVQTDWPGLIKPLNHQGITDDIKLAALTILNDPPDSHSFLAYRMLDGALPAVPADCPLPSTSIVRLNPMIQPVPTRSQAWGLPAGIKGPEFDRLIALDMAATRAEDLALILTFCEAWLAGAVPNQAIRSGRDLSCEIGFPTFALGKAAWLGLAPL